MLKIAAINKALEVMAAAFSEPLLRLGFEVMNEQRREKKGNQKKAV